MHIYRIVYRLYQKTCVHWCHLGVEISFNARNKFGISRISKYTGISTYAHQFFGRETCTYYNYYCRYLMENPSSGPDRLLVMPPAIEMGWSMLVREDADVDLTDQACRRLPKSA
jgi:hypothetical protein